jgi:WS/DGAT/MGAT family acyltransferase
METQERHDGPVSATRMSATDAVMWDIERDPVLRSTITAVALLGPGVEWERLRARIDLATRVIPRFRHRVVVPPMRVGLPRWVVDPAFDLDYHLRRVRCPTPGTLRQVLDLAQPIAMQSFDPTRPLWEMTLVEGLEGGGSALIQKLHHSLTDGVGGVELAMVLVDDRADAPEPELPDPPPPGDVDPVRALRASADDLARDAWSAGWRLVAGAARATWQLVVDPAGSARDAQAIGRSMVRAVTPIPPTESTLLCDRGLARHFDTIEVPIADLAASAHAVGGHINDALLAASIGGVAAYHDARGAPVEQLHLTMPVSWREAGDSLGGNRFAPVRFPVPAGIDDPAERMQVIGAIARRQASEPFIGRVDLIATGLDRLPPVVTTSIMANLLKHGDLVVTDVPGFAGRVFLAGAEVTREFAFAPTAGAAVNVALLSMGETGCVGVVVDKAAVPDPDLLVRCLAESFDAVIAVADHHAVVSS